MISLLLFFSSVTTSIVEATTSSFVHSNVCLKSNNNNNRMKFNKKLPNNIHPILSFVKKTKQHELLSTYNGDIDLPSSSSTFALDPESEQAKSITASLNITPEQHELLIDLSYLVVEWNERLNLISRKDCNVNVVFGRHVLPSVALVGLPDLPFSLTNEQQEEVPEMRKKVVDVGTGGGFPGLPLAILNPHIDFTLVDSVGKKLVAVGDMAKELDLKNVQTHHGRAEEITLKGEKDKFDVCVGRSVASLDKFCFWISDLLKKEEGKLVYIIGGDIESSISNKLSSETSIDKLLNCDGASDKRALIFQAKEVEEISNQSGFKKKKVGVKKVRSNPRRKNKDARGDWGKKRDNAVAKQRGYESFKRYDSAS